MTGEAETLLDRIEARRAERGLTERALSIEVTGKPDFIRDIRRFGHVPKGDNLDRLAQALGTTVDWLLGRAEAPDQVRSEVSVKDRHVDLNGYPQFDGGPGIPVVGTGDCADLELCDESGHLVEIERSSFDPDFHVRMLKRPPALRGARDLYAIQFHGSSMEPRFEAGEVGIVDPRRPVMKGDDVLVQLTSGESDEVVSVLVKRLVRQTGEDLVLQQFNPPVTFTLPKARVARIHRIMRQTDYLF